ncbi:MAG: helix-turn-helix transcriptional regulator [Cytophagales bacterium]|nr:helix-turn-helix transcriptional regulator [Cytophagales bacterium]
MTKTNQTVLENFGARLRSLREAKGFSQEALALVCEIDRTYISGLERAKRNPTLKILATVAKGLGISLSELLSHID